MRNILLFVRSTRKFAPSVLFSFFGLTLGICTALFLGLVILFELSFDGFHKERKSTYLITAEYDAGTFKVDLPAPPIVFDYLQLENQITKSTRVYQRKDIVANINGNPIKAGTMIRVDSDFNKIFDFPAPKLGSWESIFQNYTGILITETLSRKCFGTEDPVGKTFTIGVGQEFVVSGVIPDCPSNSSLQYDIIKAADTSDSLTWNSKDPMILYFLNKSSTLQGELVDRIQTKIQAGTGNSLKAKFISLADQHYQCPFLSNQGSRERNYTYLLIALVVLLICIVNHVNLTASQTMDRLKGYGIRKILGSTNMDIFWTVFIESTSLVGFSVLLSFALIYLLQSYLIGIFQINVSLTSIPFAFVALLSFFLVLIPAVLIAIYPAIVLSNSSPLLILREGRISGKTGLLLRQALVTLQFCISGIFISYTLVMMKQVSYTEKRNLGFDRKNLITLDVGYNDELRDRMSRNVGAFKNELKLYPEIKFISVNPMPGIGNIVVHNSGENSGTQINVFAADDDFVKSMGVRILKGDDFSESIQHEALVNQTAAAQLFEGRSAVGENIVEMPGFRVVGIMKDFFFLGFNAGIQPLIVTDQPLVDKVHIKFEGDEKIAVGTIALVWRKYFSEFPFEPQSFETKFSRIYLQESTSLPIYFSATVISVLVSILGLLALAFFVIRTFKRELSIRKVFGASGRDNLLYLIKVFCIPVVLSTLVNLPISAYLVNRYLSGYTSKIAFPWALLLTSAFSLLILAIMISFMNSLRVQSESPSKYLREQ